MKKNSNNVNSGIIVLGGHVQALGILRILGKKDIPAVVIDSSKKNIARHSKYCKKFYKSSDSELFDFLLEMGNSFEYKDWVIFPTNDFHVKILSQNKEQLERYFILSTDKWDSVRIFYNKKETYLLADKLQIPIANTFFPKKIEDLQDITPVFPCIIKPAVMHDFYKKVKKKVFVCNDLEDLIKNYKFALKFIPAEEIIVQDIIKGPNENQYSASYLFLNGIPYVSLTACRMRQHPIDFGNATTYAETVDIPILREYAEKILTASNYNGLCEVEFKKDEIDGRYKFLEVNTRTWKWHTIAELANAPFLELYYNFLNGKKIVASNNQKEASFRHTLTDIPIQLLLFSKGFKNAFRKRKPMSLAVWSKEDINPWLYEKVYFLFFLINR